MINCKPLKKCLCCGSENLTTVLDLEDQPLANSYVERPEDGEEFFPLALNYCQDCTHLQLTHAVNPDLLFKHYLYVSGTTQTLKRYFDEFVWIVYRTFKEKFTMKVLDIACNDGSQLNSFKARGHETYGIDPAENLYELSSKNHTIVCDYLSENSIARLGCDKFDVIIAQNVFAHNTYPKEFLEICKNHLSDGGRIFIQTSQADMVKYGQFDTVYHEHISFFNVHSMNTLVRSAGLFLMDVQKTNIHGTSYVFIISKNSNEDNSEKLLQSEDRQTLAMVNQFAQNATLAVNDLLGRIKALRSTHMIIGYGAAAKGNTVLNFGSIWLDCIVDDNPLKQGLYTPGMQIPIVSLDTAIKIAGNKPIAWIPLSWNFFREIKANIQKVRTNDQDTFIQLNFTKL